MNNRDSGPAPPQQATQAQRAGSEHHDDSGVGDWWDPGWGVRRKLTLDNSTQAQTLTNVPVLIALDATRIDYDRTRDAGEDLRFVDAAGIPLAHEIERWDETGVSTVWVRIPTLAAPPATNAVWMYYDNPSAADGQQQAAVWDTNYVGVWHLAADLADAADLGHERLLALGDARLRGVARSRRQRDPGHCRAHPSPRPRPPPPRHVRPTFRFAMAIAYRADP